MTVFRCTLFRGDPIVWEADERVVTGDEGDRYVGPIQRELVTWYVKEINRVRGTVVLTTVRPSFCQRLWWSIRQWWRDR